MVSLRKYCFLRLGAKCSALGFIDHRLHALVCVEIVGGIRVISYRKANKREVKRYGSAD